MEMCNPTDKKQYSPDNGNQAVSQSNSRIIGKIYSPTQGKLSPLDKIQDEAFSNGFLGKGIAIIPEIPEIYSPVNGTVQYVSKTSHALIIVADEGMEVLVHLGLDTVKLNGKHFDMVVKNGDRVAVGDLLLRFNIKVITDLGFDITTPVVVTNTASYKEIIPTDNERANPSDFLLEISA